MALYLKLGPLTPILVVALIATGRLVGLVALRTKGPDERLTKRADLTHCYMSLSPRGEYEATDGACSYQFTMAKGVYSNAFQSRHHASMK